jgi:hypothetical protein
MNASLDCDAMRLTGLVRHGTDLVLVAELAAHHRLE